MQQYKLIKLKQGYVIVSNEDIKPKDKVVLLRDSLLGKVNDIVTIISSRESKTEIVKANGEKHWFAAEVNYQRDWNYLKIIASTFIPELPNIDFNGLEEEIGVIDVGNLELQYYKELEERKEIAKNFKGQVAGRHEDMFEHKEMHHMVRGYLEGFNKCLELNKDKLYTLDEMRIAIKLAQNYICDVQYDDNEVMHEILKHTHSESMIIQSLQSKTEWDIKIETEWIQDFAKGKIGGAGTIDIEIPKIINNSIKILKNE